MAQEIYNRRRGRGSNGIEYSDPTSEPIGIRLFTQNRDGKDVTATRDRVIAAAKEVMFSFGDAFPVSEQTLKDGVVWIGPDTTPIEAHMQLAPFRVFLEPHLGLPIFETWRHVSIRGALMLANFASMCDIDEEDFDDLDGDYPMPEDGQVYVQSGWHQSNFSGCSPCLLDLVEYTAPNLHKYVLLFPKYRHMLDQQSLTLGSPNYTVPPMSSQYHDKLSHRLGLWQKKNPCPVDSMQQEGDWGIPVSDTQQQDLVLWWDDALNAIESSLEEIHTTVGSKAA